MNEFYYARDTNIRRFQNLLETSVDEAERKTIEILLAEEKAKIGLLALEPNKK